MGLLRRMHMGAAAAAILAGVAGPPLLAPAGAPAAAAEPIRIAVFAFDLRDVSGGSGIIPKDAIDIRSLKEATEEAKRLLAASGRYTVVDDAPVANEAALAQGVYACDGCEAALARRLGAEQSMVGIVTRVTRIVYALQIIVRDAKTGAVVSSHHAEGLSANYGWPARVRWLLTNKVLAAQDGK